MEAEMAYMTDEEADALDEELTRTIPELGPNGEGFFSGKGYQIIALDEGTARILNAKALATHRTPAELVAEMVREQLAAAAL
jgi:hypothetical protein